MFEACSNIKIHQNKAFDSWLPIIDFERLFFLDIYGDFTDVKTVDIFLIEFYEISIYNVENLKAVWTKLTIVY